MHFILLHLRILEPFTEQENLYKINMQQVVTDFIYLALQMLDQVVL